MNMVFQRIVSFFVISFWSLTGVAQCPPITPAWAFGHIVWEDSMNTADGAASLVEGYMKHHIPVNGIIIDSPWSTAYNDFNWDRDRYPLPEELIRSFSDRGVRVLLWLTGNMNSQSQDTRIQKSELYDEMIRNGYSVNHGKPRKWWKGEGIHLDFTNKDACQWWNHLLDRVFMPGVCGWKVDQGEVSLGSVVSTSVGPMSNEEFRHYYYDAMYDYTTSQKQDGIIIARPYSHQGGLGASVEKMNMGWCGDFSGDWDGLRRQIDNIYRSSQYGYGCVACEIGGFYQKQSTKNEFIRYVQFGSTTACMINGGSNGAFTTHLPWFWGKDVSQIYRFCVAFHQQLSPYMFSTVVDAHLHGGSLIRKPSLEEMSHQIGNDIFTKPVLSDDNVVAFHLPAEGEWIDFWSGKKYAAGTYLHYRVPLHQYPLFFRSGSVIPMRISDDITGIGDASMKGKICFLIYPNGNASRLLHLPTSDGVAYKDCQISYSQAESRLDLQSSVASAYVLILKDAGPVKSVHGAKSFRYDKQNRTLYIEAEGDHLSIMIK